MCGGGVQFLRAMGVINKQEHICATPENGACISFFANISINECAIQLTVCTGCLQGPPNHLLEAYDDNRFTWFQTLQALMRDLRLCVMLSFRGTNIFS